MSVRQLIEKRVEEREIKVEHGKVTYTIKGKPDASIFGRSLMLSEQSRESKAAHYRNYGVGSFDADTVAKILLVQQVLVVDPADGAGERYDEIEVATIAADHGPLFLKLFAAAADVLGLTNEGKDDADAALQAALGNSQETPVTSGSSSGQSPQPESTQEP